MHTNQLWCTKWCTNMCNAWHQAQTGWDCKVCARHYSNACHQAKADYYKKFYANLPGEDLFHRIRTSKGRRKAKVCMLYSGTCHTAESEEQSNLLGKAFFPAQAPQPCATTTPFNLPQQPTHDWRPFDMTELKLALQSTSNKTAAGELGLGYQLIKWMMECKNSGTTILAITNTCVELGYVPEC